MDPSCLNKQTNILSSLLKDKRINDSFPLNRSFVRNILKTINFEIWAKPQTLGEII